MSDAFSIERVLDERGERAFLRDASRPVSGRETLTVIQRAAARLAAAGIASGETVALHAGERSASVLALLALWSLGSVAFPVNRRRPAAALVPLLERASCRLLLADETASVQSSADLRVLPLETLFHEGKAIALPPGEPRRLFPGIAVIVQTAGTSGPGKLAALTFHNLLSSASGAREILELDASAAWLLSLPLHHVAGLGIVARALACGATIALPGRAQALGDALVALRPSHLSLVTTQLIRLLASEGDRAALRPCRTILVGGGPVPLRVRQEAVEAALPIVVSYGSTETTSLLTATRDRDAILRPRCAGHVLPGRTLRIADDGEIRAGGDTIFAGYVDAESIVDARDEEGFFATGDLGRLDPDGALVVLGRKDQMFVSGGEKIHPETIEVALLDHPLVEEAIVVAVPDEEFGFRPVAFVRAAAGCSVTAVELTRHLEERLARYEIPDRYWEMPPGGRGLKPDRSALTRLAVALSAG